MNMQHKPNNSHSFITGGAECDSPTGQFLKYTGREGEGRFGKFGNFYLCRVPSTGRSDKGFSWAVSADVFGHCLCAWEHSDSSSWLTTRYGAIPDPTLIMFFYCQFSEATVLLL